MSTETLTYTGELVVLTCWCGIRHAVPRELRESQRRQFDNGTAPQGIYCPLGHQHIPSGEPETARLKRRIESEEQHSREVLRRLEHERRSHSATKGQLTKTKKRAAAGVCPCCHRSFVQLPDHIASKHPGYSPEAWR